MPRVSVPNTAMAPCPLLKEANGNSFNEVLLEVGGNIDSDTGCIVQSYEKSEIIDAIVESAEK